MPIIIKDFTWTQSNERVCINLPLKGTKSSSLDIVSSMEYFKVSYAPFLFECWFPQMVKDEECSAIVSNGIISLKFEKLLEKEWPSLFHEEFKDKELLKKIREEALVHAGERSKRLQEQKLEMRAKNKKEALQQQMKLEADERALITSIKEAEKKQTTLEIEEFKVAPAKKSTLALTQSKPIESLEASSDTDSEQNEKNLFTEESAPNLLPNIEPISEIKDLPEPRATRTIQITFTPRVFPTPQRESTNRQETEWLENQEEARKFTELPDDLKDLSANETSLDWLKQKANDFYAQGNFQSAIGAYTHALKLFPKVPALYSNRAACHYSLRNLIKCVEDSTRALELLTPPVQDNAKSRLKAHLRRGSGFCELELYAEGLLDYEAALKIEPDNKDIIEDAENIRKLIVGTPPDFD